jgi:hypothetical protein
MPMAATTQSVAAVVRPDHAAAGLNDGAGAQEANAADDLGGEAAGISAEPAGQRDVPGDPAMDSSVTRAAPTQMSRFVRNPAGLAAGLALQADQAAQRGRQQRGGEPYPASSPSSQVRQQFP